VTGKKREKGIFPKFPKEEIVKNMS